MSQRLGHISALFRAIALGIVFIMANWLKGILPEEATDIKGMISQIDVILSVYMVVALGKFGFRAAMLLNFATFSFAAVHILILKDYQALPGLVIPLTTVFIVQIVRSSNVKLNKRNEEIDRQKKTLEEQAVALKKMAYYDALTNVMNLAPFMQIVNETCDRARRENKAALAFIDLDNFKHINDTMGHTIGDEVLKTVSKRLLEALHPEDTLCRIGGDEFALLIPREVSEQSMRPYLTGLVDKLKDVEIRKDVYSDVHASIGVAYCPAHACDADELLQCADIAMYKSKFEGKSRITFFRPDMRDALNEKIRIEQRMLTALNHHEFSLCYQPQYRIEDRQIVGYETLLRWNSEDLGCVDPDLFVPIAEQNGFIHLLGKWVLREACRQFALAKDGIPEAACLAVNISPIQLASYNFVEELKETLKETGMPANALRLEITESTLIANPDWTVRILADIRHMGVKLALDDFGRGYASLHYLQEMPLDTLKIDKGYVSSLCVGEKNKKLVSAIVTIAHDMGFQVIAEGVETQEQLALLKALQCDCIQGYLWGKPMILEALLCETKPPAQDASSMC